MQHWAYSRSYDFRALLQVPPRSTIPLFSVPTVFTSQDVGKAVCRRLSTYIREVILGLLPILVLFAIFQFAALRLRRHAIVKILIGMSYTFIGLVLFLTGANVGFMPAGYFIGGEMASLPQKMDIDTAGNDRRLFYCYG